LPPWTIAFVDRFARRIASFDGESLADIKQAVNYASLPSEAELAAGWNLFIWSVQRPEAVPHWRTDEARFAEKR
jgi:hypothetical protein